ncbi:unnamed protein product [Polarella glacialis]|uniref:Small ribosomal subunit protein eS1 n=1 Tax=Polarella glacialis TaxID=89957 RepID=A0A813I399_POLGL|nr:unnamed protein product [Polarella glacialis]
MDKVINIDVYTSILNNSTVHPSPLQWHWNMPILNLSSNPVLGHVGSRMDVQRMGPSSDPSAKKAAPRKISGGGRRMSNAQHLQHMSSLVGEAHINPGFSRGPSPFFSTLSRPTSTASLQPVPGPVAAAHQLPTSAADQPGILPFKRRISACNITAGGQVEDTIRGILHATATDKVALMWRGPLAGRKKILSGGGSGFQVPSRLTPYLPIGQHGITLTISFCCAPKNQPFRDRISFQKMHESVVATWYYTAVLAMDDKAAIHRALFESFFCLQGSCSDLGGCSLMASSSGPSGTGWLDGNPGVLVVDDILEVQCHTAGGGRQGTAICRVAEVKSHGSGQLAKLDYLRCSDEYYQYWADNEYNEEGWHHFCVKGLEDCKLKMHEGIYLVHVGFYRTLDAVSADARIRAFGGPGLPRKLRQASFPGATEAAPTAEKKKKDEGAAGLGSGSSTGPAKKRGLKKKKKTPLKDASAALDDELAQLADSLDDEDDSTRTVDMDFAAELKALKERFAKTQVSGKAASASSGSKKSKGSLTKLIAALSKSTDEESSDDDLGKKADILSSKRVLLRKLAQKHPGKLTMKGIQTMQEQISSLTGDITDDSLAPICGKFLLAAWVPNNRNVDPVMMREVRTLALALDLLLDGRQMEALDVLMQRMKSCVLAHRSHSWETAKYLELLPLEVGTAVSQDEEELVQRVATGDLKVKELTARLKGTVAFSAAAQLAPPRNLLAAEQAKAAQNSQASTLGSAPYVGQEGQGKGKFKGKEKGKEKGKDSGKDSKGWKAGREFPPPPPSLSRVTASKVPEPKGLPPQRVPSSSSSSSVPLPPPPPPPTAASKGLMSQLKADIPKGEDSSKTWKKKLRQAYFKTQKEKKEERNRDILPLPLPDLSPVEWYRSRFLEKSSGHLPFALSACVKLFATGAVHLRQSRNQLTFVNWLLPSWLIMVAAPALWRRRLLLVNLNRDCLKWGLPVLLKLCMLLGLKRMGLSPPPLGAGFQASAELRRDAPMPWKYGLDYQRWIQYYLDDFDTPEILQAWHAVQLVGAMSEATKLQRAAYSRTGVSVSEKKAVFRSHAVERMGAWVDGYWGRVGVPIPVCYLALCFILWILSMWYMRARVLLMGLGRLVRIFEFRRPLLGTLNMVWQFPVKCNWGQLGGRACSELFVACMLTPLGFTYLHATIDGMVTCSDASMDGVKPSTIRIRILCVGFFDGVAGLLVALTRLPVEVVGFASAETDPTARRLIRKRWPGVIELGSVLSVTSEIVERLATVYSFVDLVILGAGSPCQDLSSLLADRKGLAGTMSALFFEIPRIVILFRAFFGRKFQFFVENVFSMSKENRHLFSEALGLMPAIICASCFTYCRRPRLYWCSWDLSSRPDVCSTSCDGYVLVQPRCSKIDWNIWVDTDWIWPEATNLLPTFTRALPSGSPPSFAAGLDEASVAAHGSRLSARVAALFEMPAELRNHTFKAIEKGSKLTAEDAEDPSSPKGKAVPKSLTMSTLAAGENGPEAAEGGDRDEDEEESEGAGGAESAGHEEWYDIKAPSMFSVRNCGKTLITRTQGTKIATEDLKGRVLEVNLADLNNDEDQASKKIKLCIEEVQGRNCLTDFHGMELTREKICSLSQKWHTLIEAHVVKTNCYVQTVQIRKIRKKMTDIMTAEAGKVQLRELVKKLISESIGKEIEKQTQGIFPLKIVMVRKVKILKKPKFDITKLMELHGDGGDDAGVEMLRPEAEEAGNTLAAEVAAAKDEASIWAQEDQTSVVQGEDITNLAKTNNSQAESHTVVLEPAVAVDAMPVQASLLDELKTFLAEFFKCETAPKPSWPHSNTAGNSPTHVRPCRGCPSQSFECVWPHQSPIDRLEMSVEAGCEHAASHDFGYEPAFRIFEEVRSLASSLDSKLRESSRKTKTIVVSRRFSFLLVAACNSAMHVSHAGTNRWRLIAGPYRCFLRYFVFVHFCVRAFVLYCQILKGVNGVWEEVATLAEDLRRSTFSAPEAGSLPKNGVGNDLPRRLADSFPDEPPGEPRPI